MVNQDPVGEDVIGSRYEVLLGDIIGVLDQARSAAARGVNTLMTTAYWLIGRRIVEHDQAGASRAFYGTRLLDRLSADCLVGWAVASAAGTCSRYASST